MCARGCDANVLFHGPASVEASSGPRSARSLREARHRGRASSGFCATRRPSGSDGPRHRDPIFERDGWRCAVPACTARASLQDHHVIYRSHGGDNARDNRVAICAAHHLNGIHRLRIRVSGVAPHDLTWEIGFRRGRPPLLRTHGDRYLDTP